jgi:hypothetical protein
VIIEREKKKKKKTDWNNFFVSNRYYFFIGSNLISVCRGNGQRQRQTNGKERLEKKPRK